MTRPMKARAVSKGDNLRPQFIQVPSPHIVKDAELLDNATKVKITTNFGEWIFGRDDDVVFPRREDGSIRHWKNGEAQVTDLCVGDTLPNEDGDDDYPRRVTSVRRIGELMGRVGLTTDERNALVSSRYDFPFGAPISFPAPMIAPSVRLTFDQWDITDVYGPYGDIDTYGTFRWLFIAKHPSGRGRWPSFFKPLFKDYRGFRIGMDMHVIRPLTDWPAFYGKPADRHPNDFNTFIAKTDREVPTVEDAKQAIAALKQMASGVRLS